MKNKEIEWEDNGELEEIASFKGKVFNIGTPSEPLTA